MLGIIGAMEEEIANIKEKMTEESILSKAGMMFHKGKIRGKDLVLVRSGIGKVNAALCAQILIDTFNVKIIINTGIAGALHPDLNIGDIVLSVDAVETDVDASAFGYAPGQIPRMDCLAFPADADLRSLAQSLVKDLDKNIRVYEGRISTADRFIAAEEQKGFLFRQFGAYCTEMEGAAIAHTAYVNQVRCLIIRAISDKADGSANLDYKSFEAAAIAYCSSLLLLLIDAI